MCSDFIKKKKHVKVRAEIIKKNQRTIYVINNVYKLSIAKQNKQKHVIRIMPVNTFLLPIDRYHFFKMEVFVLQYIGPFQYFISILNSCLTSNDDRSTLKYLLNINYFKC